MVLGGCDTWDDAGDFKAEAEAEWAKLQTFINLLGASTPFHEFEQLGYNAGIFFLHMVCAGLAISKASGGAEAVLEKMQDSIERGPGKERVAGAGAGSQRPSEAEKAAQMAVLVENFKCVKKDLFRKFAAKKSGGK